MSDLSQLKFFTTQQHPCSYLEDRQATTLFLDPATLPDKKLHSALSREGFRRSGNYLYRPHCKHCNACIPVRVDLARFVPNRRFKRISRLNQHLQVTLEPARFEEEFFELYVRYIAARHKGGDMYPPHREQFDQFLFGRWSDTHFACFRNQGKLISVAVIDLLDDGWSAVYNFFDPQEQRRSLGTYSILWQITEGQRLSLPYLYLGYLIEQSPKMSYKADFAPLQMFTAFGWQAYQPNSD